MYDFLVFKQTSFVEWQANSFSINQAKPICVNWENFLIYDFRQFLLLRSKYDTYIIS